MTEEKNNLPDDFQPDENIEMSEEQEAEAERISDVDYVHPVDLELAHKVAFHSRTFKAAGKAAKEELYKEEHVISDRFDNQLNILTPAMMRQEDMEDLSNSAMSEETLEGTIVGVQHINPKNEDSTPCAVIMYGHNTYKILIPYYCMFDIPIVKEAQKERPYEIIKRAIRAMISCDINFVVRQVDEKNQLAIADRLKALSIISYRNFRRKLPSGKTRVVPGALCEAKVIRVGVKDIMLCVLGSDVTLKSADGECSWNHVSNLATKFHVGQWIKVRVLGFENYRVRKLDNEYDLTRLNVSIKQATEDPADMYWNMISENQICLAYYSGNDGAGHYFAHLFNEDGPDILLAPPRYNMRKINFGEKIRVRVNIKREAENGKKRRYEGTFVF